MVDIVIKSEAGKLHAVYHKSATPGAPLAVVMSGNPRAKLHMNDRVSYATFRAFMDIGFSVVRFNYRGVGDSDGTIGTTTDNMLDIATVIDWIQNQNEDSEKIWLAGHGLGAWYTMGVMMRRPEISGFVLISPDPAISDYSFLSPRPNRGLIIMGANEDDAAHNNIPYLQQILKKQSQISTEVIKIKNADATFGGPGELKQLYNDIKAYVGREDAEDKLL